MFVNGYANKIRQLRSLVLAEKGVGAVDLLSRFDVRGLAPGRTQWLRLYALLFDGDYEGMLELVKKSEYEYVRDQGLKIIARVCQKRLARITGSNNHNHLLSIEQIWELVRRLLELCTYQECLSVARILRSQKVIAFIESRYADTVVHDLWMYGTPEDMPRDVESFTRASLEGKILLLSYYPNDAIRLCLEMDGTISNADTIARQTWFQAFYRKAVAMYRLKKLTDHELLFELTCKIAEDCYWSHDLGIFKFRNPVARKLLDNHKTRADYAYPETAEQFLLWMDAPCNFRLHNISNVRPKKLITDIAMALYNKYAKQDAAKNDGAKEDAPLPSTFAKKFSYDLFKYLPVNVRSQICTRVFCHIREQKDYENYREHIQACLPFIDWNLFYPYASRLLNKSVEYERSQGYECFFKYIINNPDILGQCELMTEEAYEIFCETHKGKNVPPAEKEELEADAAGEIDNDVGDESDGDHQTNDGKSVDKLEETEAGSGVLPPTEGLPLFMRRLLKGVKKERHRGWVLRNLVDMVTIVRRGSSFEFPIYNCFLECLQVAKNEEWIRSFTPVLKALLVTNYRVDDTEDSARRRNLGMRFIDCLVVGHDLTDADHLEEYLDVEPLRDYLLCTILPKAMKGRTRTFLNLPDKYLTFLMPDFKRILDNYDGPLDIVAYRQHWHKVLRWFRAQVGKGITTENLDGGACVQKTKLYTEDDYLNLLKRLFPKVMMHLRPQNAPLSFTEWVKDELRKNAAKVEFERRRYIKWLRSALRNDEISDLGEDLKEGGSIYCPYEISAGMSAEDYEGDCYLYWRHNSDLRFVRHLKKVNDDLIQNNRVYQPAIINLSYLITSCSLCDVRDVFQCLLHSNDKPSSGKHVVFLVTRVLANPVYYLLAIVNMTMAHPHTRAAAMRYLKPYMFGAAYIKPFPNRLTHGSIIAALMDNPDTCTKTLNEFDKVPSRPGSRSLDTQVSEMKMPEIPEMNVDKIWDSIKTDNLTDNDILWSFIGSTLECPNQYSDRYYHLIFQMLDPGTMPFQGLLGNLRYGNHPKNDRTLVKELLARIDLTAGCVEEFIAVFVKCAPNKFKFVAGKNPDPDCLVPFSIHRTGSGEGTLTVYLDSISAPVLDEVVKSSQFSDLKSENALTLIEYISHHEYSLRLLYDLFEGSYMSSGGEMLGLLELYATKLSDHDLTYIVLMAARNRSETMEKPQVVFDLAAKLSKNIGPLKTSLLYGFGYTLANYESVHEIDVSSAQSPSVFIRNAGAFADS
ncbi:hypothetical protein GNI_079310 [Gregarina niphandrodes]|uniref:Uncharacterized protein n=1 Tax=Gregarina niphandrodes TaxID=110365 RepID=A0A023B6I3_GRENI|nr:hypothetical protein GNI_079310 [Gregarina niphandrodes]EZG66561.1 hypothetical protein GNI_079310 [Gregarina niphandrodes]|eukprot:XP_011130603.1 hypothetical protein GNI_079310 [Gregarina niphandrodes]